MCSVVIAPSAGADLPLVGSGSTQQEDKQPPPSPPATIPPKTSDDAVKGFRNLRLKYFHVPNCNRSVFSERKFLFRLSYALEK